MYVNFTITRVGIEIELDVVAKVTHWGCGASYTDPGEAVEWEPLTIHTVHAGLLVPWDDLSDEEQEALDIAVQETALDHAGAHYLD